MDVKEFRIGNKVDLYGSIATIEPVDFSGIGIAIKKGKPIPLTEEWLLKLGFEKIRTFDVFPTFFRNKINVNDGIVYVCGCGFLNHIKYVHQLQNLYHALTGEELTLNN